MTRPVSGRQIAAARALLGLTQADLARQIGVHRKGLSYWELRGDIAGAWSQNLAYVVGALENLGIEFIESSGVRLRQKSRELSIGIADNPCPDEGVARY